MALAVANATGTGILLTSNRTGVSCDVNSSSDTTVPAETFQTGTAADNEVTMTATAEETPGDVAGETSCSSWRRAGVMIEKVEWDGLDLVITVEMTPRGMPPETDLGDFEVTLVSGTVIAYDAKDRPLVPQPATLPSLNITDVVAHPWDWYQAEYPDWLLWPFPPVDFRFYKEFRVTFQESDFPQVGGQAARYDMPITITNPQGGYCSTPRILNEGKAVFSVGLLPFIAVSNFNAAADDNFRFSFGGTVLGDLDFSANGERTTYVFMWSDDAGDQAVVRAAVEAEMGVGELFFKSITKVAIAEPIAGSTYALSLVNIKQNLNGNRGKIALGYAPSRGSVASVEFTPADGANWTGTATWGDD